MRLYSFRKIAHGFTQFHALCTLPTGSNNDPSRTSQFRKMCFCILFCCHIGPGRMWPRVSNSKQTEMQRHLLLLEKRQTIISVYEPFSACIEKHAGSCEAALVALLKLCFDLPLERKLPDGYRETWLEAIGDLDVQPTWRPKALSFGTCKWKC